VGSLSYGIGSVYRVENCNTKIVLLEGHFIFTCSDTFADGMYMVWPQTDRQTDNMIMPVDDRTTCSTIG